jgi:hypothetical protein
MEVQECLEGIFKLLHLDPSISFMQQPDIDQILCLGEAPTTWTRARQFSQTGDLTHMYIPTCCGPWHKGAGHFVTFYLCQDYLSIIDPLEEDLPDPPPRLQFWLHKALRESFTVRNLPIPPLPAYRKLPKIAVQQNAPIPLW